MKIDLEGVKKHEKWIWLGVCFLLVFLMYGRTIFGDFVFDDRGIADHATMLSDPNQLHLTISLPYWTVEAGLYRPVVLLSYALNFFLLGDSPWGFHLVNLLLYAFTGFLIARLIFNLFGERLLAYMAAALFLVLPIHTEAVANISGRSEIMALGFSLLLFLELLRDEPKIKWWLSGLWFFLAIGSKETAIAALPIAALIIWLKEKNLSREIFLKYLYPAGSILAGALAYFGARFLVLGRRYFLGVQTSLVENPLMFAPAKERLATALKVLAMYLQKTFWPIGLCSDYSYNQIPILRSFFTWPAMLGAAAIIIFIVGVFIFWKRSPAISFGCAWFLLSFFLVSNFLLPIGTIAGERLMFYPSLGICLIITWLMIFLLKKTERFSGRRAFGAAPVFWLVIFLFSAGLIFYSVISFQRAGDWLTEKSLYASAAACAPQSVLARSNFGAMYYLDGNLADAKKELLAAQAIYDGYPKGVNNLGLIYWKEGDKTKARELFLKALNLPFPFYGAYENLAMMAIADKNWLEVKNWILKFYSGDEQAADAYIRAYRGY